MAGQEIAALVVDVTSDAAQELLRVLKPEIQFSLSDFTSSLRKAAVSQSEEEFQICFLSEKFSQTDVAGFFSDMKQIGKTNTCIFVQVRDAIAENFDRSSLVDAGFTTVISRKGTHEDKSVLKVALQNRFHVKEVTKRKLSVDDMMSHLLEEIDRAASDHRRGVHRKMAAIRMDGIELDVQFDTEVLNSYFSSLTDRTAESAPRTIERLEIPDEVLRKALPGMTKEGYGGASHRVWEFLSKKYGVKIGEDK